MDSTRLQFAALGTPARLIERPKISRMQFLDGRAWSRRETVPFSGPARFFSAVTTPVRRDATHSRRGIMARDMIYATSVAADTLSRVHFLSRMNYVCRAVFSRDLSGRRNYGTFAEFSLRAMSEPPALPSFFSPLILFFIFPTSSMNNSGRDPCLSRKYR